MALASGSLLIPISLGQRLRLPGWLRGIQAIRLDAEKVSKRSLDFVAERVCEQIGASWKALPPELRHPKTICSAVLRTVLLDQFSGPGERTGAWSRQYDRYLRHYYGDRAIRRSISQGASLTFTAMLTERLSHFASSASGVQAELADAALGRAADFVLASQHKEQGGFGRRTQEVGTRGGRKLHLDMRHTCWAVRALLSIDARKFTHQIKRGLEWLAWHARHRGSDDDRWCWTTAPLLALMSDPRLNDFKRWRRHCVSMRRAVMIDLEKSFDDEIASWVKGEKEAETRSWVSVDNALYVMYCLKDCRNLSPRLKQQRRAAIQKLLTRSCIVGGSTRARGVPMFEPNQPEVGPTAQLIEIMKDTKWAPECEKLARFVAMRLADRRTMPSTFSWHLSSVLTVPGLRDQSLVQLEIGNVLAGRDCQGV
jgi:hypothetical protein